MRAARVAAAEDTYRCAGCGARWSYETVRYVALCPECASGLVRVSGPETEFALLAQLSGEVAPEPPAEP